MPRSTTLARRLVSGIYGRLEFDFACNRGHAFSEAHLHGVMMEILASNIDPKTEDIHPSFAVPALQRDRGGKGRKREVDFAISTRRGGDLLVCAEAKWAGSSHATELNILTDLTRLALIDKTYETVKCLFVLAGGKTQVERLLDRGLFKPHGGRKARQLLRYPYDGRENRYPLRNGRGEQSELSSWLRSKLAERVPSLPARIQTNLYKPAHETPPDWSVQVWRVWCDTPVTPSERSSDRPVMPPRPRSGRE